MKKQFRIDIHQYCNQKSNGAWNWNESKLQGTDILNILNSKYNSFKFGMVQSVHLKDIILHYSDNQKLNELVSNLRSVVFIARVKYRRLQTPFVGNCRINGWGKCRF